MNSVFPTPPAQPRRVHSGQRAPIRDEVITGVRRVHSGQRRPIGGGPQGPRAGGAEPRPGRRRPSRYTGTRA